MKKPDFKLGLILLVLGLIGVSSLLTVDVPLPEEARSILKAQFTDGQIKLLGLVQPTFLLVITVALGTFFHRKASLFSPLIQRFTGSFSDNVQVDSIIKSGAIGGVIAGVLMVGVNAFFVPLLPEAFNELSESLRPTLMARFLFGGVTEEIIMRFGVMSFVVYVASQFAGSLKPSSYWIGIFISAILFGIGHLPVTFQAVANPPLLLISYVILGNLVGGIVFGWLYWKKGLESAFIAHILAHVVMLILETLLT